ncbi:hypothetical protein J4403_01915 [Candidatus Woesearchaeota archaeon]|nr:hypothetical protein [Candidatus Woesearchaeota archaeon]
MKEVSSNWLKRTTAYINLKNKTDLEIKLENQDPKILLQDSVYTSSTTPYEIKEKMRKRTLTELEYKSALEKITSVQVVREDLDKIPVKISPVLQMESKCRESYLLQICKDYKLTLAQLKDLVFLKNEYSSNFNSLIKILEKDYSIEDVGIFLVVRRHNEELVHGSIHSKRPSLSKIVEFYETFNDLPLDEIVLGEAISIIHKVLDKPYIDMSIKKAIKIAKDTGVFNFELLKERLETEADRYNSELQERAGFWREAYD